MTNKLTSKKIIFILLIVIIGGCNILGERGLEEGTFQAIIEGDYNRGFQGEAVFESYSYACEGTCTILILRNGTGADSEWILFYGLGDIKEGTYEISANYTYLNEKYYSTKGTLKISKVAKNSFEASFEYSFYQPTYSNGEPVGKKKLSIFGVFNAQRGDTGFIIG